MQPDDAVQAVERGVAGIYVSNHGGRAVDHAVSSAEALWPIVDAVGDRADVMVDSGFIRGADVLKGLALGAKAVGIGRLQCWGLSLGGAAGLIRVFEILQELANMMASLGCSNLEALTTEMVRWSPGLQF